MIFGSSKTEKNSWATSVFVAAVMFLFGFALAGCSIGSAVLGNLRDGGEAIISFSSAIVFAGGAVFAILLGFRTIVTGTTQELDEPDDFSLFERSFTALIYGCCGVVAGLVIGGYFATQGEFQTAISSFGISVLLLGLIGYKSADWWWYV